MKNWPLSFPALLQSVARGGHEARLHLVEFVKRRPHLVLPHIGELAGLLDSTREPVQHAALETLAILSHAAPGAMAFLLPRLHAFLANDPQHALAGHAIEILLNYGRTSAEAAKKVIPILGSLKGKHADHATKAIDELRAA